MLCALRAAFSAFRSVGATVHLLNLYNMQLSLSTSFLVIFLPLQIIISQVLLPHGLYVLGILVLVLCCVLGQEASLSLTQGPV